MTSRLPSQFTKKYIDIPSQGFSHIPQPECRRTLTEVHELSKGIKGSRSMQLIPFIIPLMAVFALADDQYTVTADGIYDAAGAPTQYYAPACAGKLANSYPYFHDFSNFPNIGGASFVNSNTAACGSCWRLTYTTSNNNVDHTTVTNIAVINSANSPALPAQSQQFIIAPSVYSKLAQGQLVSNIVVLAQPIDQTTCGFPPS